MTRKLIVKAAKIKASAKKINPYPVVGTALQADWEDWGWSGLMRRNQNEKRGINGEAG